jgi:hypothetical protein
MKPLVHAFDVARRSREKGDYRFGALLAGPDGAALMEQCTGLFGSDMTAHVERLRASRAYITDSSANSSNPQS